jgi:RNA polymerase sigma-70 factor (ECF subfamily)
MIFRRRQGDTPAEADRFAVEALDYLDNLYGAALRLTRRREAAEDLVQDTYLKAFRARDRFTPGSNLKAWLFTILQNTWRNRRRGESRSRVEYDSEMVEHGEAAPVAAGNPELDLVATTMDADVQAALDALPEAFRQAVWLRDVEELTYQEIADILAVPIGTVMSRISRGRKQLHQALLLKRQATIGE